MDATRNALLDIRNWAAKGEARDMGRKAGLELPEDDDFPEETPGVEQDAAPAAKVEVEAEGIAPEQLEELLRALTAGG